ENREFSVRDSLRGLERAIAVAQQQPHTLVPDHPIAPIRHRQIKPVIAVEIAGYQRSWVVSRIKRPCGLEGAVAIAREHPEVKSAVRIGANSDHVELAVAVEISGHETRWAGPDRVCHRGIEAAVAPAQKQENLATGGLASLKAEIRDGQVELTVGVEVAGD